MVRRQRGYTLIELMIALVLTFVLIAGILLIHLSGRGAYIESEQLSRIQENVRFASDHMIRDIRNAGFRDEGSLRAGHELQIRTAYANIVDGNTLTVRYAGRGHCTEAFDEFRLVENEYSMSNTGELRCRGRSVAASASGDTLVSGQAWGQSIGLVRGLTAIAFQNICPAGGSTCACNLVTAFDTSCIGVRVAMQFEGLPEIDDPGTFDDRTIELTAAFRNIILDRVNEHAFASEDET